MNPVSRSVGAVLVLLASLALGACAPGSPAPSGAPSADAPTPSARPTSTGIAPTPTADPDYAGAQAVIPVKGGPRGVAFAGGSIWVAATVGGEIERIDPATNEVVARIRVALPVTLVSLDGQLWASVLNVAAPESDDQVVRIDLESNTVAESVEVPVFHNIAAGGGNLWAVDAKGILRSVDPATSKVVERGSVGGPTVGIAANESAVWGIRSDGAVWRLPIDGGTLGEAPLGVSVPGRSRVAVGPGPADLVWVAVPGTVLGLDPDSLAVRFRLPIVGMTLVNDLWVGADGVWLSANVTDASLGLDGGSVLRLDPATATIAATYRLGPESSGAMVVDGTLWAVDQHDNVLARFPIGAP